MNFSQKLTKVLSYFCWVAIILISIIFLISTSNPTSSIKIGGKYFTAHKVDPVVSTHHFLFKGSELDTSERSKMYLRLQERSNFYSTISGKAYSEVFYRPDFANYPAVTLLILFFRLCTLVGMLLFLFLLSNILKSVSLGDTFNSKNHKRLFYMGLVGVILPLIRTFQSALFANYIHNDPTLFNWIIEPAYSYLWLSLIGVIILIFSYVFKEATRIYEEQKLTV